MCRSYTEKVVPKDVYIDNGQLNFGEHMISSRPCGYNVLLSLE